MRFVIDESSFDLDEIAAENVADAIFRLGQTLSRIRVSTPERVGLLSGWGSLHCWRGMDVAGVLTSETAGARDDRLLLLGLLDKCVDIQDEAVELDLEPDMVVAHALVTSYGIALAHRRASSSALWHVRRYFTSSPCTSWRTQGRTSTPAGD